MLNTVVNAKFAILHISTVGALFTFCMVSHTKVSSLFISCNYSFIIFLLSKYTEYMQFSLTELNYRNRMRNGEMNMLYYYCNNMA